MIYKRVLEFAGMFVKLDNYKPSCKKWTCHGTQQLLPVSQRKRGVFGWIFFKNIYHMIILLKGTNLAVA